VSAHFVTVKNEAGVALRTYATVELEVPSSMGKAHREHLLALVLQEALRLGMRSAA
jgi:hypothetical protein